VETAGRAGDNPGDDANECPTSFQALKWNTHPRTFAIGGLGDARRQARMATSTKDAFVRA